jgi:uncharacterized repeat protein (TIGR03803 family)
MSSAIAKRFSPLCVSLSFLAFTAASAHALQSTPTLQTLANFAGGTQGATPSTPLIQASDGNFYGATLDGGGSSVCGGSGCGTIFRVTPGGVFTTIHAFTGNDGEEPSALLQATDGNFYGTTAYGGTSTYGTVFQLTPDGKLTTLHNFSGANGGAAPNGLVQGIDGALYGTTRFGDSSSNNGSVFKITSDGAFSTIYESFPYNTAYPQGLLQATDGNFYGVLNGSFQDSGGVFRMTPSGQVTLLAQDLASPEGTLVEGADGNLYGTAAAGESAGGGSIFQVTPSGQVNTVYSFGTTPPDNPGAGLFLASDGNYYTIAPGPYASSSYFGGVIQVTSAGAVSSYVTFPSTDAGVNLNLLQGSDGNFYGVVDGSFNGGETYGNIFRIIPPSALPGPVQLTITPAQISEGDSATLTWNVANGTSDTFRLCFGSGAWSGIKAASGSMTLKPTSTGDYNYVLTCGGAETGMARLVVAGQQAASTTGIVATSSQVLPGGSTTLLVNVNSANGSGPTPTGSVTLFNHGAILATGALVNGGTTFMINGTEAPIGPASFTAHYTGDANYSASTSSAAVVTFQAIPTLTLKAPTYVTEGQSIPFTVTVSGPVASPVPMGTVTVSGGDGYNQTLALVNGSVTATVPSVNVGTYFNATVTYNGDSNYLSIYQYLYVNVFPPSTVTISSSATQVLAGQSVSLVAQVTGSSGYYPATGSVSFQVGSLVLGTGPINSGIATLTASSKGVPPGTYPVTAVYSGDANNGVGTSAPLNITVKDGTNTSLAVTPNPVTEGQLVTLTTQVTRASTTGNPGGKVIFSTGSLVLGAVNLSGGGAVYSVTVSGIPTGTYPVIATYSGDANDASSVSPTVNVTVQ